MKNAMMLILCITLFSCAKNPVTGSRQLLLVSEEQAIAASKTAYASEVDKLKSEGKLSTDKTLIARIHTITARLIAQAIMYRPETRQWDWSVQIINDDKTANAYCMAGGRMAIYTGIIHPLNASDDEIAQVMGHEIAHALSKHSAIRMSNALGASLVVGAIGAGKGDSAAMLSGIAANLITLKYSRDQESESDEIGILLAAKAGYDPAAAITLWQKMAEKNASHGGSTNVFFSTHPSNETRIAAMKKMQTKVMPFYLAKDERPVFPLHPQ